MRPPPIFLLAVLALSLPAWGQAYKCRQPDGSTQISSEPCAGGARTLKEVDEEIIPDDVRAKAERDAERQRRQADKLEADRRADEAEERKAREQQRRAAGGPTPEAIQYCLDTLNRMNLDKDRRGALETGCVANGRIDPVYTAPAPSYYGGTYYPAYPAYPRPPRPVPRPLPETVAPDRPSPAAKPVDLYKTPSAPRGSR